MTPVTIILTVQLGGEAAAGVAYALTRSVEAGDLNHAALNMLRGFLAPDTRDWKVSHVSAEIGVAVPGGAELRRQLDAVQTQLRNRNADIAELRARLAAFEGGA